MQFKPITATIVLLLMVTSLLVSGCVNNTTNQTPSASTATHDAFLEKFLAAAKDRVYSNSSVVMKAWEVTWVNSTSAHLQATSVSKPSNYTWNQEVTYVLFPTSQDATNYLNAMNKTGYSLASTEYPSVGIYKDVTGHAPQIYKQYVYNEGNANNISEFKRHNISQADNVVLVETEKVLYTG